MRVSSASAFLVLTFASLAGCQGARRELQPTLPAKVSASGALVTASPVDGKSGPPKPGTTFDRTAAPTAEERVMRARLAALEGYSTRQLLADHALPSPPAPTFRPGTGTGGLAKILKSQLAPSKAELAKLATHGFVVRQQAEPATFANAYADIYAEHLPLYISADSIFHVLHRSFDTGLSWLESDALVPELKAVLRAMRERLGSDAIALPADVRRDLDVYLTVGASLLDGKLLSPAATASRAQVGDLFERGMKAQGVAEMALFGATLQADFSQLKPRGHYASWNDEETELTRYFRAMMWFGRTELRLVEIERGKQVFHREAVVGALAFLELMTPETRQRYARIDETVTAFVGEHDALHVAQLDGLQRALGVTKVADLAGRSDEELIRVLVDGNFGAQRIASQIQEGGRNGPAPLPLAFALFGQRYTVDSHVLSSVSYDRVPSKRMMPSPLDVGYAALGNDRAAALLAPELANYRYAPQLEQMRVLVDSHETAFWGTSLGASWLSALRALSPSKKELADPAAVGLPAVFTTEAWGRRLLSTQLASWAELRHDTILYTKQSLSSSALCEFPDAYVEPYPEVWARLGAYASKGVRVVGPLETAYPQSYGLKALHAHFLRLAEVVLKLEGMARAQRAGKPFTAEQMAFVNDAVAIHSVGCGSREADGWYPSLFLSRESSLKVDVTIADVHTQPTDENGGDVGRVLHVGTGFPRFMTVTVETCHGPRAYMGVVSAFHEQITERYTRLRDSEWDAQIRKSPPADPAWMADLVAR